MVTWLDRLARSTRDLLNILDAVGKAGAAFSRWVMPGPIRPRRTVG
jgi:DNA invertase Pin-like site-specific DNA recombinase